MACRDRPIVHPPGCTTTQAVGCTADNRAPRRSQLGDQRCRAVVRSGSVADVLAERRDPSGLQCEPVRVQTGGGGGPNARVGPSGNGIVGPGAGLRLRRAPSSSCPRSRAPPLARRARAASGRGWCASFRRIRCSLAAVPLIAATQWRPEPVCGDEHRSSAPHPSSWRAGARPAHIRASAWTRIGSRREPIGAARRSVEVQALAVAGKNGTRLFALGAYARAQARAALPPCGPRPSRLPLGREDEHYRTH